MVGKIRTNNLNIIIQLYNISYVKSRIVGQSACSRQLIETLAPGADRAPRRLRSVPGGPAHALSAQSRWISLSTGEYRNAILNAPVAHKESRAPQTPQALFFGRRRAPLF